MMMRAKRIVSERRTLPFTVVKYLGDFRFQAIAEGKIMRIIATNAPAYSRAMRNPRL